MAESANRESGLSNRVQMIKIEEDPLLTFLLRKLHQNPLCYLRISESAFWRALWNTQLRLNQCFWLPGDLKIAHERLYVPLFHAALQ